MLGKSPEQQNSVNPETGGGLKAVADEESGVRCGGAGTSDWMPCLSVSQETGQRENLAGSTQNRTDMPDH